MAYRAGFTLHRFLRASHPLSVVSGRQRDILFIVVIDKYIALSLRRALSVAFVIAIVRQPYATGGHSQVKTPIVCGGDCAASSQTAMPTATEGVKMFNCKTSLFTSCLAAIALAIAVVTAGSGVNPALAQNANLAEPNYSVPVADANSWVPLFSNATSVIEAKCRAKESSCSYAWQCCSATCGATRRNGRKHCQ